MYNEGIKQAVGDAIISRLMEENEKLEARLAEAEALLKRIRPGAMFASCQYNQHEDADPTFHCCDWNKVVKEIDAFLWGGSNES